MFNLLLALMVGILIGWNFHAFFLALDAPKIIKNEINISNSKLSSEEIIKPKVASVTIPSKEPQDTFQTLLTQNHFSDAMTLYLEAKENQLAHYREIVYDYFEEKRLEKPEEALTQILEYIELEPEHYKTSLQLIETYKTLQKYRKAINLIIELLEGNHTTDQEKLNLNLLSTSQSYIDFLTESKSYAVLNSFLNERIEYGLHTPFYTYHLAKYEVMMQQFTPAIKLLKELEFDETYAEKAKNLLEEIQKQQNSSNEYKYKLPLEKKGSHFTIEVTINQTPLTLLLDTGATMTMVNDEKLSSLTMIDNQIMLNTVGGEIPAQLQEAQSFVIGEIELKDFKVITSTYQQPHADGLLGMNFFKNFKFKIDQEEQLLYLSERKDI